MAKRNDAAPHCRETVCETSHWIDVQTEAHAAGNLSTAFFAVGGVGVATAAVLWFTGKPSGTTATQLTLGMGSVMVGRAW